eukprot:GHVU01115498.1.p1 GENE.GHVU01115498.1~~GHVU01115498.1.p1  ORF type:complete len:447 (-),score=42.81 GHVU01115498.1:1617-2852(-)
MAAERQATAGRAEASKGHPTTSRQFNSLVFDEAFQRLVTLADMDRRVETIPTRRESGPYGIPVIISEAETIGLVHFRATFDTSDLTLKELLMVPMLAWTMHRQGEGGVTGTIVRHSAITPSDARSSVQPPERVVSLLSIRGAAVREQAADLGKAIADAVLDLPLLRHKEVLAAIRQFGSSRTAVAFNEGLTVMADVSPCSGLAAYMNSLLHWPPALVMYSQVAKQVKHDWPAYAAELEALRRKLIRPKNLIIGIVAGPGAYIRGGADGDLEGVARTFVEQLQQAEAIEPTHSTEGGGDRPNFQQWLRESIVGKVGRPGGHSGATGKSVPLPRWAEEIIADNPDIVAEKRSVGGRVVDHLDTEVTVSVSVPLYRPGERVWPVTSLVAPIYARKDLNSHDRHISAMWCMHGSQ